MLRAGPCIWPDTPSGSDDSWMFACPESTPTERDWIELTVRRVSRLAGYLALAAAVAGIAYLVIR